MKIFRLIFRFSIFVIIVAIIIVSSVLTYLKSQHMHIYDDNSWDNITSYNVLENETDNNIALDTHSHTVFSDGVLTPRQSVLWHIAMGYNAMFITDHNTLSNQDEIILLKEEFKDRIIIMQGMEWTTDRIHINFLDINEWDFTQFPIPSQPSDEQIAQAIGEAKRQDAIVVACHYIWTTADNRPTREKLLEWGVDYFEIINDDCNVNDYYDEEAIAFCEDNGLGLVTGTDMHFPNFLQVDGKVHGWTLLNTDELTEESIMEQLRLRNTSIKYLSSGAPSLGYFPDKPGYKWKKPFIEIGRYFRGIYIGGSTIDWYSVGIILTYLISTFVLIEILRYLYSLLFKSKLT